MKVMKKLSQASILTTITLSLVAGFTQAADEFAFGGLSTSCFSYPAVAMTPYDDSTQSVFKPGDYLCAPFGEQ